MSIKKIMICIFLIPMLGGCNDELVDKFWKSVKRQWGLYTVVAIAPIKDDNADKYQKTEFSSLLWKEMNNTALMLNNNSLNGRLEVKIDGFKPNNFHKLEYIYKNLVGLTKKKLFLDQLMDDEKIDSFIYGYYSKMNNSIVVELSLYTTKDKYTLTDGVQIHSSDNRVIEQEVSKLVRNLIEKRLGEN